MRSNKLKAKLRVKVMMSAVVKARKLQSLENSGNIGGCFVN